MRKNGLGKWGENAISHWNKEDYIKAKEEIAKAKEAEFVVTKDTVPENVRQRMKENRKNRRNAKRSAR